jgi:trigger factor
VEGSIPEIAGKRVRMDLVIKDLKEKIVPEMDDDFAREVGKYETLEDLKQAIREQILKREEEKIESAVRRQIVDHLLERTPLELPEKVIEREVDGLIAHFQHQLESQGLKLDPSKFNTPEIRADYRPQAEKNLRQRLIFAQIARQEQIELSEIEEDAIFQDVARYTRMDVEAVREHADSTIVEQAKEGKIHEKVFALLEEGAVFSDAPIAEEA